MEDKPSDIWTTLVYENPIIHSTKIVNMSIGKGRESYPLHSLCATSRSFLTAVSGFALDEREREASNAPFKIRHVGCTVLHHAHELHYALCASPIPPEFGK